MLTEEQITRLKGYLYEENGLSHVKISPDSEKSKSAIDAVKFSGLDVPQLKGVVVKVEKTYKDGVYHVSVSKSANMRTPDFKKMGRSLGKVLRKSTADTWSKDVNMNEETTSSAVAEKVDQEFDTVDVGNTVIFKGNKYKVESVKGKAYTLVNEEGSVRANGRAHLVLLEESEEDE